MDTSQQYIKMCQEAREIQEMRKWDDGDFYFNERWNMIEVAHSSSPNDPDGLFNIWLPRQDQLQEILTENLLFSYTPKIIIYGFFEFSSNNSMLKYQSMEQLWLAFIMKENFNKQWNLDKEIWESIN